MGVNPERAGSSTGRAHLMDSLNLARVEENTLGEGRLSGVNVGRTGGRNGKDQLGREDRQEKGPCETV